MSKARDPDALADAACDLLDERQESDLEELKELLRIPSVSTDPKRADDVRRAAAWVRDRLAEAGVDAEVVETDGHPCVIGEHVADEGAGGDRPTLLWYGHYDVQPEDPLDEWTTPPFEPTVRDGKLYARGAVDDKGQVHLHLAALRALSEAGDGTLPVDLKVLLEGEEEVGSANLGPVLEANRDRLACDAVIISDTSMVAKDVPTVTTGLRGLCYFEVTLRGTRGDLHSGVYGGAVINPANALAALLASFRSDDGTVDLPGFYDDVEPLSKAERESLSEVPFDEEAYREMLGAPELWGEEGHSVLERLGARPTFDVNGLTAGYQGEGAKTVIPATASAKVSMRLVPDQEPDDVASKFEAAVRDRAPDAVEVEVVPHHHARPWRTDPTGPFVQAAVEAARAVWGKDPVYLREGGTIPVLSLFEETLGEPIVLFGFGLPDGNIHAPDENLDLDTWRKAREAVARFYVEAGGVAP